jgi:hypothetical protein
MRYIFVQMHIETAVVGEEFAEENNGFVEPFEVGVETFAPGIPVRLLFNNRGFLDKGKAGNSLNGGVCRAEVIVIVPV